MAEGEGEICQLVMFAVGDYPMLISVHATALLSLFELRIEQRNHGALRESINQAALPMNIQFWIEKFENGLLKTLKCTTSYPAASIEQHFSQRVSKTQ